MPLYDLERGCKQVEPERVYLKFVKPVADQIDQRTFRKMCDTIDTEVCTLKPSTRSQLTWTMCAALIGYMCSAPTNSRKHLWDAASDATKGHPDACRMFVGSIVLWRISLIEKDVWLSSKSKDKDSIHPYRTYWINNDFIKHYTVGDLASHFGGGI